MITVDPQLPLAAAAHAVNREGWLQAGELALALLLSAAIGLEREIRQKNAGLRTHTLVGVGAALFMLISKYGFTAWPPHCPNWTTSTPCWLAT